MKQFVLNRKIDITGVSGTGIVACGVVFPNGKCAINWLGEHSTVTIYDSLQDVQHIHLHHGNTEIVWNDCHKEIDELKQILKECEDLQRFSVKSK